MCYSYCYDCCALMILPACYVIIYKHECKIILGDPGADSGGEGKSKRAEKYGTKKSKERREEPLGTMSYQTSSKWSLPFWLLIGARKLLCFSAQSEENVLSKRIEHDFCQQYTQTTRSTEFCCSHSFWDNKVWSRVPCPERPEMDTS